MGGSSTDAHSGDRGQKRTSTDCHRIRGTRPSQPRRGPQTAAGHFHKKRYRKRKPSTLTTESEPSWRDGNSRRHPVYKVTASNDTCTSSKGGRRQESNRRSLKLPGTVGEHEDASSKDAPRTPPACWGANSEPTTPWSITTTARRSARYTRNSGAPRRSAGSRYG